MYFNNVIHALSHFNNLIKPIHEIPREAFFIGRPNVVDDFQNMVFECKKYKDELYKFLQKKKQQEDVLLVKQAEIIIPEEVKQFKDHLDSIIKKSPNISDELSQIFEELSEFKYYKDNTLDIILNLATQRFLKSSESDIKIDRLLVIIDELLQNPKIDKLNLIKELILNLELTIYVSPKLQDLLNELYYDKLSLENIDSIQEIESSYKILLINDSTDERKSSNGQLETKINMFHLNEKWFPNERQIIQEKLTIDSEKNENTLYDIIIHNNPNNKVVIGSSGIEVISEEDGNSEISELLETYEKSINENGILLTDLNGNSTNPYFTKLESTNDLIYTDKLDILNKLLLNGLSNYTIYKFNN